MNAKTRPVIILAATVAFWGIAFAIFQGALTLASKGGVK